MRAYRGRLVFLASLAVACATIPALSGPASATIPPRPAAALVGTGCPAGMRVWTSSAASVTAPQSFTPGSLSSRARTEFEGAAARLLARHNGQHKRWRWIRPTSCPRSRSYAEPAGAADPGAPQAAPQTAQTSANWSGFISNDGDFTGVSMEWNVPVILPQQADGAPDVTIWPGIGGFNDNGKLIQAGVDGTTAWTEVVPGEPEVPIAGFTVSPGDDMAADVEYDTATDIAVFFMVDYTQNEVTAPISQAINGTTGASAEWIVERDAGASSGGVSSFYRPLADFGDETILNGAADQTINGKTTQKYIGSFSNYGPLDMSSCAGFDSGSDTPALAAPGAVDSEGDFTDAWKATGAVDPVNCNWTISPAGAAWHASLNAGTAVLNDTTAGAAISCTSSTISGTTGASPQPVARPLLATMTSSSFGGCSDGHGGGWSVAQAAGTTWDLYGDAANEQSVTTGDISGVSATATGDISGETCSFQVAGTVPNGDVTYSNSDASTPDTLRVSSAALTITNVTGSGCATLGIKNNDAATLAATYIVTSSSGQVVFDP